MSATNAHVGDIRSPKQKIVTLITHTIIKMLSINGSAKIAIDATRHPMIIGVNRENTAVKPFYHKIGYIPPNITEAIPEIKDIDVAILICERLRCFTLIK